MGARRPGSEDAPMTDTTRTQTGGSLRDPTGRSLRDPSAAAREARRLVGLERHYHCESCGHDRRSWARMSACPDCGEVFALAVIHRAAVA
jgi:hypothetical protein